MEGASGGRGMLAPLRGTGLWLLELRTDAAALWPRGKGQRAKGRGEAHMFSRGAFLQVVIHRDQFTDLNAARLPFFPLKHGALLKLHVEGERRRSLQGRIFSRLFLLPVPSGCAGRRGGPECQAPAHRTKSAQGREAKGALRVLLVPFRQSVGAPLFGGRWRLAVSSRAPRDRQRLSGARRGPREL